MSFLKNYMNKLTRADAEAMEREMYPLDGLRKEATRQRRQRPQRGVSTTPYQSSKSKYDHKKNNKNSKQ